jgi:CheY-like chemotaxis protein
MSIPQGPILVVEDTAQIRELLEVTLQFEGYPVVTAKNGEEALRKIAEEKPALIITDLMMPKMDGFGMVYRLRGDEKTRNIPIVILSATYVTKEDRDFALSLGVAKFIEKPLDTPEFLLTIGEIMASEPSPTTPQLEKKDFYRGYRERLESKLQEKKMQIGRIERLLQSLDERQKGSFEALLREAKMHQDEIVRELNETAIALKALE